MYQMGVSGSAIEDDLLPEMKRFLGVICKRAVKPSAEVRKSWSRDDVETYGDQRRDLEKAVENLLSSVGDPLYEWMNEFFAIAFTDSDNGQKNAVRILISIHFLVQSLR